MTEDSPTNTERPFSTLIALVLVGAGGALGTMARYLIATIPIASTNFPLNTFLVNVLGSCALGWLYETLSYHHPKTKLLSALRLSLGTGLIGGFTTYSTFSAETAHLISADSYLAGIIYGLGTVILGLAAAAAGIALGHYFHQLVKGN